MLRTMPTNMSAWPAYFDVYHRCIQKEPPDLAEANAYYQTHRIALDAGAEASWEERKLDAEVSAIQHAMHLFDRDRRAFMAEFQNEPEDSRATADELTAAAVAEKLSGVPRGQAPAEATRVTAFVDVGRILFFIVVAWDERFGGTVADYGTWPRQVRPYFSAADARPSLADAYPRMDDGAAIYSGLKALTTEILGRSYPRHGVAGELRVERALVDAGWGRHTDTVHQFCRASPYAAVLLPSKGHSATASSRPMNEWKRQPGDRVGWNWKVTPVTGGGRLKLAIFDPNAWKTFVHARLRTPFGTPGALGLFGGGEGPLLDGETHRLFADHVTAEYRVETEGRGRKVQEWQPRPGRENHWLDCLTGAAVAASIAGLAWSAAAAAGEQDSDSRPSSKPKTVDFGATFRQRHGR